MSAQLPEKITTAELKHHLDTQEMRNQLVQQITKDLDLEPPGLDMESDAFFSALHDLLVSTMRYKIEAQPQSIANIIYRVDLHETKVKRLLANPDVDASVALAEEIILREMKKVFYRNVYAGRIKL